MIYFLVGFLGSLIGGFMLLVGFAVAGAYRTRRMGVEVHTGLKWVRVSEGLPEPDVKCLIIIRRKKTYRMIAEAKYYPRGKEWSYHDRQWTKDDEIVAWMPEPPFSE